MSRQVKELKPFNEAQLILLFCKDSKVTEMVRMIRTIDKMRNGFITKTELTDILKECYPDQLKNRDLSEIVKPYQSENNKILCDYKSFLDTIVRKMTMLNANFTLRENRSQTPRRGKQSSQDR